VKLIDKGMKFIKIKSVEILTNGSLNFTATGCMGSGQTIFYKKDYKSLEFAQKQKNISKFEVSNNFYKTHYKF
jgi:hypothetical protein